MNGNWKAQWERIKELGLDKRPHAEPRKIEKPTRWERFQQSGALGQMPPGPSEFTRRDGEEK